MITSKYFNEEEFQACNPPCSLQDMKQSTMDKMDKAREIYGRPIYLNCAYRSSEHDKVKGRSGTGSHTLGYALDPRCENSSDRYDLVIALLNAGFKRIGIAKNFIHADDSPGHSQNVIWTY